MRLFVCIFLAAFIVTSCVKPNTKNPVPEIEFKDFQASKLANRDTAVMTLGYQDGDGDLFVDYTADGPNIIITTYVYRPALNKFTADVYPGTSDTFRISSTIKQPDNGYYKGKSIRGDIMLPMTEYRIDPKSQILKFTGFMVDAKKNKSNVFTSPVYTLTF